nr:alpha/beta hydrolase [Baekduia alba]
MLDPQIAAAFAPTGEWAPPPVGDVATRRAFLEHLFSEAAPPVPADVSVSAHHATSADGAQIELRWYAAKDAAAGPAAIYFHGGGYIFGNAALFDGAVAAYASTTGVSVLAVDYRLAPEHPHPVPLEDAYAALTWLHERAAELSVDVDRIAVMGESAGGGLAAALAILARDRGGPKIVRQILIMPMLDDRTDTPDPNIAPHALWSYDDNTTGWRALLGTAAGGPDVAVTAAPARLQDAVGLPPAYIEVGQLDVFRDESIAYATILSRAGVPVELHLHPGVPHIAFEFFAPDADVGKRIMADRFRVLGAI